MVWLVRTEWWASDDELWKPCRECIMNEVRCVRYSHMMGVLSLCIMFVRRGSSITSRWRVKVVSYLGCLGMRLLQSGWMPVRRLAAEVRECCLYLAGARSPHWPLASAKYLFLLERISSKDLSLWSLFRSNEIMLSLFTSICPSTVKLEFQAFVLGVL